MLSLSLFFHLLIFSSVFFIPQPSPTIKTIGTVYEVNLVEMPQGKIPKTLTAHKTEKSRAISSSRSTTQAKRIHTARTKRSKVIIAKRTIAKKAAKAEKPHLSSAKLLDDALSSIERKTKIEKNGHIDHAISRLENRAKTSPEKKHTGGYNGSEGIEIRWYQIEVESRIKSNWAFPVALAEPKSTKDLEATVLLKVKNDGSIIKSWLKKGSSNAIFDQSVLKAIERSDPLPPFPEGYRKTHDQIEINFNLKDLE